MEQMIIQNETNWLTEVIVPVSVALICLCGAIWKLRNRGKEDK